MKNYLGRDIRNVAVIGHAHSGKTTLVAALLQAAKMTPTQGRVEDGSAVTAYDEEEVARRTTMANALAFAEWGGVKINLVDTPGFHMFLHETRAAMLPVEAALVVVNAQLGIEAVTDRVWKHAAEVNLPRVVVVSQVDHPKADSRVGRQQMIERFQERWGRQVVPVQLPIVDDKGFHGVVDLVTMQAFLYQADGSGHGEVGKIPDGVQNDAKAAHEALVELVAEGKDELMEEFFEKGTIPEEHLIGALHEAIREDRIFPVLYASGLRNVGTDHLLDFLKIYAPAPTEREPVAARGKAASMMNGSSNGSGSHADEIVMRKVDDAEPLAIFAYKTMTDPFTGRVTFFKVISGKLKSDATLQNYTRGETETMQHLYVMQGRKPVEVQELHAGDLGAAVKLKSTLTGDTLGEKGHEIFVDPVTMPEPAMTYAIEPKSRADEDKLAPALHKLMEDDPMVRFFRDPQTNEFLVAGAGQPHIEALVSKLSRRYHTNVILKAPKVPYLETVRGRAEAQGRHKKQTGGHGQFGDCKLRIEPMPRGGGFVFANEIFGGAIPRQYVPAVEKGVRESAARGYLAGYPVVDFKITVVDGSYHDVDSSEMAFKLAARLGFRKCMEQAKPALLEPVMKLEIEAPDEFAGALMGDLSGRRGRVQGMESGGSGTMIRAEVPMAEVLTYGTTLTSMTQGRGSFRMEMDHYDLVPQVIAEKILAAAKQPVHDEEEIRRVAMWLVRAPVHWFEKGARAQMDLFSKAQEAVRAVCERAKVSPRVGIILGSGLGGFAAQVVDAVTIPYAEIPHFPQSTVAGHSGKLVVGTIGGVPVAVMQGRVHAYEGYAMEQVTFPARVLGMLGCRRLIVTNAAGGIRATIPQGSLVAISDHINLTGTNAALGPNEPRFATADGAGQRFFDMTTAYSPALRKLAMEEAARQGITLEEGVYLAVLGPSFETPAEIRAFRTLGADLVGMSTVHEVIVARHMGIEVLGISLVTNMAAGVTGETIQHEDVMEIGRRIERQFTALLTALVPQIDGA